MTVDKWNGQHYNCWWRTIYLSWVFCQFSPVRQGFEREGRMETFQSIDGAREGARWHSVTTLATFLTPTSRTSSMSAFYWHIHTHTLSLCSNFHKIPRGKYLTRRIYKPTVTVFGTSCDNFNSHLYQQFHFQDIFELYFDSYDILRQRKQNTYADWI